MIRLARKFTALPCRMKLLTVEAIFFLFSAKILLLIFPVKRVLGFSVGKGRTGMDYPGISLPAIGKVLADADRLSFWKNRCLVKSLAGRWMLQRRGLDSRISFGVRKNDQGDLTAHAWLRSGDFEVVAKDGDYVEFSGN